MMTQAHYPRFLQLLILISLPVLVLAMDKGSCRECIGKGCTYCKADDFFGGEDVCMCESNPRGCDGLTFGSFPLESRLDCAFASHIGEFLLAVIIIVPICFFGCVAGGFYLCCRHRNKRRSQQEQSAGVGTLPTAPVSGVHPITTTAFSPTAAAAAPPETAPRTYYANVVSKPATSVVPFAQATIVPPSTNPNYDYSDRFMAEESEKLPA